MAGSEAGIQVRVVGIERAVRHIPDKMARDLAAKSILAKVGTIVQGQMKMRIPKRSGATGDSIRVEPTRLGAYSVKVGTKSPVARWLEEGTGIYGPLGHRIFPISHTCMRWPMNRTLGGRARANSDYWYARSTKGQVAKPWIGHSFLGSLPYVPFVLREEGQRLVEGTHP